LESLKLVNICHNHRRIHCSLIIITLTGGLRLIVIEIKQKFSVKYTFIVYLHVCAAYEYVADSEEATLSQCESVRSFCSVDDAEFRSKTQQFFEGMARLRQEAETEQLVGAKKTHTVSRSFYPRRVSDNISHRTDVLLTLESPSAPEPSGANLYQTFSNRLLLPGPAHPPDRRRSASSASEKRASHELEQFLRVDRTERSLSVTSTPSTLQRPLSRQSESEESISMVDVTWQHRKPTVRKRQRPRPKQWEETVAETFSVVRTSSKLKPEKAKEEVTIRRREMDRQREKIRREEIAKQLEIVERQERKIKEELEAQQKMLQQFTAVRKQEIERERIQDSVRQEELLREQEAIRKQEITRMSELRKQHEMAKQLAFQHTRMEVEQAAQVEKVEQKVESQMETSFFSIDISSPVKSELQRSTESTVTSIEAVKLPPVEDKSSKLEMVVERSAEMPLLSVGESLDKSAETRPESFDVVAAFTDERETLESPAAVKCTNIKTVLPPIEKLVTPVPEDGTAVSVAKEVIHSEQEILTAEDLRVVELVEESFEAKPAKDAMARHSQSSEDDVFYDASDVDVLSVNNDVADGEVMLTGSLLMAPVFELPLADVTASDGAGAILECRVTGNPTPEVMWFVNGVEIRSMPPEVTVSYHAGVCRLVVVDVMPDDEGEYTVRAFNEAGSCLTSAYLTVLRKLSCSFRIFSCIALTRCIFSSCCCRCCM